MNLKIGEKIRALRLQQKMTQEQLADRLGVSYQSVSRWENGITYPDIELLPAIANYFSVSLDYLMGQDDAEKRRKIKKQIRKIANMDSKDEDKLIELIRICRTEKESTKYFEDICYALRYSSLYKSTKVIEELRKSKEAFFEECDDASMRSRALEYYTCLEEESHIKALLDRYSSDQTTAKDYLLKERYLFRDEFDLFELTRQRYLHKQIAYLIDGDISLWRDSSKPMNAEYTIFENNAKLSLLHGVCRETPTEDFPVTCGKNPDVFAEQRIYIGMRQACAYVSLGETEKAYRFLEDVISLLVQILQLPNGTELTARSPALDQLKISIKKTPRTERTEELISLLYSLENGEKELAADIFPQSILKCLETAQYARWEWLTPIRKEERFVALLDKLKNALNHL